MARERLYAAGRNILLPLGGFVTGWVTYRVVEEKGLIDESYIRQLRMANLKMQLYLQQNVLPVTFTEKYCYPEDFLKTMIERLSSDAADEERWTFEQVLKECAVSDQIAWLEEHVTYDIPYFYISDLFNSWCSLHRNLFISEDENGKEEIQLANKVANGDSFLSEVLCNGVVEKTLSGVLPYDVAVRTLCVLAVGHKDNARLLSKLISSETILERYEDYVSDLSKRDKLSGDVIPLTEVGAATLELLRVMNAVTLQQQQKRWSWWPWRHTAGDGSSHSNSAYPLAAQLERERWCRCFGEMPPGVATVCSDGSLLFADALTELFKCRSKEEVVGAA
ncbi:uncharacterized protein TM35_000041680 [Trypanosoma theileri]|uniref:Uncharacterized protein n=1 Tax=Trypanosoma theileri TaxID=67003 RepID=A0A1X0P4T2_9TRYP|nr:uncharacterized protein TM35_000041680 [Trypanosoma theileri]ORC91954.1 hypothetical protein TM35_000041680 [Trypanosoma theileri]